MPGVPSREKGGGLPGYRAVVIPLYGDGMNTMPAVGYNYCLCYFRFSFSLENPALGGNYFLFWGGLGGF